MIKKRTLVIVNPHNSKKGEGLSYPRIVGTLEEDCNGEGWDVVEVRSQQHGIYSVYSFDVKAVQS